MPRRRLVLLAGGMVGALCVAVTLQRSSESVGAPDPADPETFAIAGNGELPTKRPDLRAARAPLSTEEAGYAAHLAQTMSDVPEGATDVRGDAGAQVLFADLPRVADADGSARLAVVVLYDYTSDAGYQVLVDLTDADVRSTGSDPEMQPPIGPDEADAALDIAVSSPATSRLREQFEAEMGVPLLSREQVHYKAGTWRYDGATGGGEACGKHRCARVLVQSPSGSYLPTSDFVIDLTARSVVVLEEPDA